MRQRITTCIDLQDRDTLPGQEIRRTFQTVEGTCWLIYFEHIPNSEDWCDILSLHQRFCALLLRQENRYLISMVDSFLYCFLASAK